MELEVLNAALAKHIRPATFPLAIRMVAPDEAFPERTERPKSDLGERIAICQGSALARHCGWAVGMTTEDVSCPLALAVWGLKPMLGYFLEGMTCADMYTRTPAEGVVTEASVDKWEYGQWQGAVAAPLRRAAFDPHLVLLYGCSARVMRPVTARLWSSGGRSSSSFAGRIDCADAVIATMKTGECQVIPACYGDRGLARHLRKREPAARMRGLWCRACLFRTTTWSEEGVQLQRPVHIGLAVSLGEEGLIVPVLRDAEQKSLRRLATEVGDLARRARARQLAPDEVRGGTFTITNHGVGGSLFATPIISQPQSAILGVGAIQKRVVVVGDAIAIRPMVYLSLSFDHRLLDGASADAFLATIVATLEKGAF